jgi:phospholipase/carboxylesterase
MASHDALVVQQPPGPPQQLILLFHGMGSNPRAMRPLGERLASDFPHALVVAPAAPNPSPGPNGFEWFGIQGITEENRPERVASAMPAFEACIAHWQQQSGVDAAATALVGFSQGAIMALESAKRSPPHAGRIVAIGGRFAALPTEAQFDATVHFLHGKEDAVIPYSNTVLAAHHLRDLGCDVTAEVLPFVGHEIHPDFIDLAATKLTTHISSRVWAKALEAAGSSPDASTSGANP